MLVVRAYKLTLSPVLHLIAGPKAGCRFHPTCSDYALDALKQFGFLKGGWLAFRRILRCNPFHPGGHDPVPKVD